MPQLRDLTVRSATDTGPTGLAALIDSLNLAPFGNPLCAEVDPAIFYPDKGGSAAQARAICARCPVTAQCLEWAMAYESTHPTAYGPFGVVGGLTPREREDLRRASGVVKTTAKPKVRKTVDGNTYTCRNDGCDVTYDTARGRNIHQARFCTHRQGAA